jgi:putative ABC transport system substrate-binding protein
MKLLGVVASTWPLAGLAQRSKVARIGALYLGIADGDSFKKELREGLRPLGYAEGQNLVLEFRSADGRPERLPQLAAELVKLKVDVIVALYVPCALAAKQATSDIPIVILAGDPVETGIVPSLARPGGNVTGMSLMAPGSGKSVELFGTCCRRPNVSACWATLRIRCTRGLLDRSCSPATGRESRFIQSPWSWTRASGAFAMLAKERTDALVVGKLSIQPVADLAISTGCRPLTPRLCRNRWLDVVRHGRSDHRSPGRQVRPRDLAQQGAGTCHRTTDQYGWPSI